MLSIEPCHLQIQYKTKLEDLGFGRNCKNNFEDLIPGSSQVSKTLINDCFD